MRGFSAWRLDHAPAVANTAFNRAIALLESCASPTADSYRARVWDTLGQMLHQQGLYDEARRSFETALALRPPDDAAGLAITLGNLGRVNMELGDFAAAEASLLRDLQIVAAAQPPRTYLTAQLHSHLGTCALELGNLAEAARRFGESERLSCADDNTIGRLYAALGLGRVALAGDRAAAAERLAQARGLLAGGAIPAGQQAMLAGQVDMFEAELRLDAGDRAAAEGAFTRAHSALAGKASAVEEARLLYRWAQLHLDGSDEYRGARLLRDALKRLDATSFERLRGEIEAVLQKRFPDLWLLHSAGRFIGQRQIELLLEQAGRTGFRGTGQTAAVLFTDIREFTGIAERLGPEALIEVLNGYLGHMTRCIEQFGGYVDKFIGDAIMALFLPGRRGEVDLEAAARAALLMFSELERFNRMLPAGTPKLRMGLGLHVGAVVSGLIGSPQKRSFTVIGDPANTASRMEGMTKRLGAQLLVSDTVAAGLGRRFLLRPLGAYRPKGRDEAVSVLELMGEDDGSQFAAEWKTEIAAAAAALERFRGRDFAGAETAWQTLIAAAPQGPAAPGYRLLADEAARLAAAPPPDDWNGAITLTEK